MLFEIPDVMNLSNSDCAARYDVTNADGTIDHNPLEAYTRGTALPDFSSVTVKASQNLHKEKASNYRMLFSFNHFSTGREVRTA